MEISTNAELTIVRRAYQATDVKVATRLLTDLAKRLQDEYPSAASSVREGLEETPVVDVQRAREPGGGRQALGLLEKGNQSLGFAGGINSTKLTDGHACGALVRRFRG